MKKLFRFFCATAALLALNIAFAEMTSEEENQQNVPAQQEERSNDVVINLPEADLSDVSEMVVESENAE